MNVSAVSLGAVSAIASRTTAATKSSAEASSAGPATVTTISREGDMLSHLSELQTSDPEQFQATMKQMSDDLRAAAKEKGGEEGQRLSAMADKVDKAAKTGDLSELKPPSGKPPAGGHGGPPPAGGARGASGDDASSSSSSSSSSSTDPADANGDGTVTAVEQMAYDIKHPEKAEAS
jgi:hypothetical protein